MSILLLLLNKFDCIYFFFFQKIILFFFNIFINIFFFLKNFNLVGFILLIFLFFILIYLIFLLYGTIKETVFYRFSLFSFETILIISILYIYIINNNNFFQYSFQIDFKFPFFSIPFIFSLDNLSISLIILSNYIFLSCAIISLETVNYKFKDHSFILYILFFVVYLTFCCISFFWFYVLFELILIPMILLIGIWGSRKRKIKATYQFFIYTMIGSFFLLISLIYIYIYSHTFDVRLLNIIFFPEEIQYFLWIFIFIAFAIKTPLFPFHIWLPEAHVEAPTTGSIILAGILLKLGIYGMLRFLILSFKIATVYFIPFVYLISILGILYISINILSQIDLKKIIAYSSIIHMSFSVIGIFNMSLLGISGGVYMMLYHGFVSSSLFLLIGILYSRYHTRILFYYKGLFNKMPVFSIFFFLFLLCNLGFPGTGGFVSEFLILQSTFQVNKILFYLLLINYFLNVLYTIWLVNRIIFGSTCYENISIYKDISLNEFIVLVIFLMFSVLMGIFPNKLLNFFSIKFIDILVNLI